MKMVANRESARKMGLKGRAYLESHFSRAVIGGKLVKLLEEMIDGER